MAYRREGRRWRRRRGTGASGEGRAGDSGAGSSGRAQWPVLLVAVLPGLAAMVALLFTWREVRVTEQGQLTSRFNDAISNLGSPSLDVRFGGIYALERIMQDSPRDQPRIVLVLSAYVRRHASVPAAGFAVEPAEPKEGQVAPGLRRPPTDVTAVVNVLAHRSPRHDGDTQVDWSRADLRGLFLTAWAFKDLAKLPEDGVFPRARAPFAYVNLEGADLRHADLSGVDLRSAFASEANLSRTQLLGADLREADLSLADLTEANVLDTNLSGADLSGAILRRTFLGRFTGTTDAGAPLSAKPCDLSRAVLRDADLTSAVLTGTTLAGADLTDADLRGADLTKADLHGANLTGANLKGANLTHADLTGVVLTGAELTGARTEGARGLPASAVPD